MNTQVTKARRCPACRKAELQPATYVREFHPHGDRVAVELLTSRCPACGAEVTSAAQHSENLARLKARKAEYKGLLLGEEILALRRRYGITQQAAARIFGKGKIAFSRYENESSYPDDTATKLLSLAIEKPDVIKALADEAGETLPMWPARCQDERATKLRLITVHVADPAARRLAQKEMSASDNRVDAELRSLFDVEGLIKRTSKISVNDDRFDVSEAAFA